ncbi:unnamed protein product, partial [marine sediment metagenome]
MILTRGLWGLTAIALFASATSSFGAEAPARETVAPDHAEKMAAGRDLFRRHVRALLIAKCVACHGRDELE